jgi:hypothetical protein
MTPSACWRCLSEELGILMNGEPGVLRDVSHLDGLPSVHHVVVFCDEEPVGTARLMGANSDAAQSTDTTFGFEIERSLDPTSLGILAAELGEVSRLCVLRHHATRAALPLYEGFTLRVACWVFASGSAPSTVRRKTLMRRFACTRRSSAGA